jgi:hypothetical protein
VHLEVDKMTQEAFLNKKCLRGAVPFKGVDSLPLLWSGLKDDRIHYQWNKLCHNIMHILFVKLVHQYNNDWKFSQDFQGQHSFWNDIVLKKKL